MRDYKLAFFWNFIGADSRDLSKPYNDALMGLPVDWKTSKRYLNFIEVVLKHYPFLKDCNQEQLNKSPWADEIILNADDGVMILSFSGSENSEKARGHLERLSRGFRVLVYDPQKTGNNNQVGLNEEDFFIAVELALSNCSFDEIEGLRDYCSSKYSEKITNMYFQESDWIKKDLIIQLIQDHKGANDFEKILLNAINSPYAYSKIISIEFREGIKTGIDKYTNKGEVIEELLERDAKKYIPKKVWWKFWLNT